MPNKNSLEYIGLYLEAHREASDLEESTGKPFTKETLEAFVEADIEARLGK